MMDDEVVRRALGTASPNGLSSAEARRRLRRYGANEIQNRPVVSAWAILGRQFKGAWTWLLLSACLVSVGLHQVDDAALIAALLVLGGLLAFLQELHAERSLLALRAKNSATVRVLRDGALRRISALELVQGDLLVLGPDDPVEADARLLWAEELSVLEHALSGESRALVKSAADPTSAALDSDAHSVFRGSRVCMGWGLAEIRATGPATRLAGLGQAAGAVSRGRALLEEELEVVGKELVFACAGIVGLVVIGDLIRSRPWSEVFLSGVSLAVAAVPESLPAVVTLALALGARALGRQHVLVRELAAIETAGATTVICTGKTGILTAATPQRGGADATAGEDETRAGVREAVQTARAAGIRTLLLTGDAAASAEPLARQVGIWGAGDALADVLRAGASVADKLDTIRALQRRGHVVAMTGESTNNAPALRAADVGFALRESDAVTREASDMILLDNDFPHIIMAIQLGRGIYDNIRKTIVYLMAGNIAELGLMLFASVLGLPPPLSPLQLLWINLITDGPPAFALVCDPIGSDVLEQPPRPRGERLLGRKEWGLIGSVAALQTCVCLGVFAAALGTGQLDDARNRVFSVLVFTEILWSFVAKNPARPFWRSNARSNVRMLLVVAISVASQIGIGHLPLGRALFGGHAPGLAEFARAFLVALLAMFGAEASRRALVWAMANSRTHRPGREGSSHEAGAGGG